MNSRHHVFFKVFCSIGNQKIVAVTSIDRKNKSAHFHLYGEMFGNKRSPIQVKHSDMLFTEGEEPALITKILTDHFSDDQFHINSFEELADLEEVNIPGNCLRMIVRLKGYQ